MAQKNMACLTATYRGIFCKEAAVTADLASRHKFQHTPQSAFWISSTTWQTNDKEEILLFGPRNGYTVLHLSRLRSIGGFPTNPSPGISAVAPTLFVLLEARFGESTIQNYDGLLRNKPTASRLGMSWRVALTLMLALPIALSVAYKTLTGGESRMEIDSFDYISNKTYYGMFQPPGILLFNGVSGFFNATTAFREATKLGSNGSEPPIPTLPSAYGYNILLLNGTSAAALDTFQADYVIAIQERLAIGESWTMTAPVTGTVATFSMMKDSYRQTFESDFVSHCQNRNAWDFDTKDMFNGWSLTLMNRRSDSDQSIQYIGLEPTNLEYVRVKYRVDQAEQIVFSNRPTLRKSPWLYLVLAIQPFLMVIILGLTAMLHSETLNCIDKPVFGLQSFFDPAQFGSSSQVDMWWSFPGLTGARDRSQWDEAHISKSKGDATGTTRHTADYKTSLFSLMSGLNLQGALRSYLARKRGHM
ncbi:hypothetical protein CSIM01_12180 [Colletotrichum simmondsii]|uniref:Uncharacterized protein n=1 Tax=Colletotrichum simmondsii TaxID=703756 RepID=A0A135T7A8_9PEZI|nr:hypothetical protein CSIM01_12180 [Colletotrichum simmondsii]